uniref:Putative secreted peptide n=1 Tax=Anopheles braziliensis TaxID=58242 RepID=A0A2M3ZUY4_9DIPT
MFLRKLVTLRIAASFFVISSDISSLHSRSLRALALASVFDTGFTLISPISFNFSEISKSICCPCCSFCSEPCP